MINLRQADVHDEVFLFDLKNEEEMRKYSIVTHDKIKWEDHIKWCEANLQYVYIAELDGEKCGDIRVKDGEVAIKVHPDFRGKGVAYQMLSYATEKFETLTARIVDGNVPSMRLFIKCGFQVVDHKDNYYILKHENTSDRT